MWLSSRVVKPLFRKFGIDLRRANTIPLNNLRWLREANIRSVLDVGANQGQFARWARALLPEAQLFCFEPLPGPFAALQKWCAKNSHATALNFALGERQETSTMYQHQFDPSSSILPVMSEDERQVTAVPIRIDTLDALSLALEREVLVKLDVQGFEDRVIRGGMRTIGLAKVCICEVDVDRVYEGQCNFGDVWRLMDSLGLSYAGNLEQTLGSDGHVSFLDAIFMRR